MGRDETRGAAPRRERPPATGRPARRPLRCSRCSPSSWSSRRSSSTPSRSSGAAQRRATRRDRGGAPRHGREPIGFIDAPASESIRGPAVVVSGWALAASGIRAVEGRIDGRVFAATLGLPRPDVAALHAGMPGSASAGFRLELDLAAAPAQAGVDRRRLALVAIAHDGSETPLGTRSVIEPAAFERWRAFAAADATPFHLLPALSGLALGAAAGLDTHYADYVSPTTRVGTRIPVLYLRTTRGAAHDYAFDPDWDVEHRCPQGPVERRLSDDSLNGAFRHAVDKRLPMLFTLNGGIWGDAACDAPQWDVNDVLEQDPANCQWSEKDEVVGDDSPQEPGRRVREPGARAGAHAQRLRARRAPLQAAQPAAGGTAHRALRARAPRTLRRREPRPRPLPQPVLRRQGVVRLQPGDAAPVPALARRHRTVRRALRSRACPTCRRIGARQPLTLADASRLAGRRFASWDAVDPPRVLDHEAKPPYWELPWVREWETFRRHLVDLHYDELSRWLVDAGIPRERIWSSQGFMAPLPWAMPFALTRRKPGEELRQRRHVGRGREARAGPPRRDPLRRVGAERHPHGRRAFAVRRVRGDRPAVGRGRVQLGRPVAPEGPADLRGRVPRPARHVELRRALRLADGVVGLGRPQRRASPATTRSPPGATRRSRTPRRTSCSRARTSRRERSCGRSARPDMPTRTDGLPSVARSRRCPAGP